MATTIWEVDDGEREIEGLDDQGRPDPAYAEALGLVRAPYGRRLLAAVIDAVVYLILQIPSWAFAMPLLVMFLQSRITAYGLLNHPRFVLAVVMAGVSALLTLAFCVVQLALHGRKGVTIGKGFCGLRSVNVRTLERPGFWRVVLRLLIIGGAGVVPVLGPALFFLSPLWDPERRGRGWHDMAAQLWMIDVRRGLQPYDDKRMRIARKTVKVEVTPEQRELPSLATPDSADGPSAYRPAGRVSAGVLGVARPHRQGGAASVGLTARDPGAQAPAEERPGAGRPVVGGYRARREGEARDEQANLPQAPGIVLGAPADLTGAPPAHPAPLPPAPASANVPAPPAAEPPLTRAAARRSERPAPDPARASVPTGPDAAPDPAPPAPVGPAAAPDPAPAATPAPGPGSAPSAAPAALPSPGRASAPAAAPAPGAPSSPAEPPAAPPPPAPAFRLTLDTGAVLALRGAIVLGRDPRPHPSAPDAHPVPVPDETRSSSKTHLLLRATARGVEIVDLGSTNGTALVRDGVEREATPGSALVAEPGDAVRFGDRTLTVSGA